MGTLFHFLLFFTLDLTLKWLGRCFTKFSKFGKAKRYGLTSPTIGGWQFKLYNGKAAR